MRVRLVSVGFLILATGLLAAGCVHGAERSASTKATRGTCVDAANPRGVLLGSIDKEAIRAVISEHAPEIRSCYEKRLAVSPGLHGKVAIKWLIQPDGSTSDADAVDEPATLRDPELHACMTSRIATWRFPEPCDGGVAIITYPWIFRVQQGAAYVQGAERSK